MPLAKALGIVLVCEYALLFFGVPLLARVLPAGLPAVVVLALTTGLGVGVGRMVAPSRTYWARVIVFATGVVACAFWAWAAIKIVSDGDQDLGVVSFALVIVASAAAFRETADLGKAASPARVAALQRAVTLASGIVAANYAFVIVLVPGLPTFFVVYLVVGLLYWACAVAATWQALGELVVAALEGQEESARLGG